MSYTKKIFDELIGTSLGSKIAIPCASPAHRASVKTMLQREKQRFLETHNPNYDIIIEAKTSGSSYYILLYKTQPLQLPVVINSNGRIIKEVDISQPSISLPDIPVIPLQEDTERLRKLMEEDGLTEETIENYLSPETSIIDVPTEEE